MIVTEGVIETEMVEVEVEWGVIETGMVVVWATEVEEEGEIETDNRTVELVVWEEVVEIVEEMTVEVGIIEVTVTEEEEMIMDGGVTSQETHPLPGERTTILVRTANKTSGEKSKISQDIKSLSKLLNKSQNQFQSSRINFNCHLLTPHSHYENLGPRSMVRDLFYMRYQSTGPIVSCI